MNRRSLFRRLLGFVAGAAVAKVVPDAPASIESLGFAPTSSEPGRTMTTSEVEALMRANGEDRQMHAVYGGMPDDPPIYFHPTEGDDRNPGTKDAPVRTHRRVMRIGERQKLDAYARGRWPRHWGKPDEAMIRRAKADDIIERFEGAGADAGDAMAKLLWGERVEGTA